MTTWVCPKCGYRTVQPTFVMDVLHWCGVPPTQKRLKKEENTDDDRTAVGVANRR